jgi:hypothetical protein
MASKEKIPLNNGRHIKNYKKCTNKQHSEVNVGFLLNYAGIKFQIHQSSILGYIQRKFIMKYRWYPVHYQR